MKTILTLLLLLSSLVGVSQNCKYEKNDIDQFTGKMTKLTKPVVIFENSKSKGFVSIQKTDEKFAIIFVCDGNFNIRKEIKDGSTLSFLLETGKVITITKSTGSVYQISKTDILELMQNKTISCRVQYQKNNELVTEDIKVKKGDAARLTNLVKCVL